jgi:hypothetical protein
VVYALLCVFVMLCLEDVPRRRSERRISHTKNVPYKRFFFRAYIASSGLSMALHVCVGYNNLERVHWVLLLLLSTQQ